MTYPPPSGTPDPYQPPDPHRAPEPYQPPPAYDPTAVNPYPPPDPYRPSSPYQAPDPYAQQDPYGPQASGVPYSAQPYSGQPYSGQPYAAPPPQYGAGPYQQYAGGRTNGLAVASLVCSLAGLLTCVGAPLGVVLGHVAKSQIRTSGEAGEGLATAGLIIGYVLSVLGLVFCGLWATGAILSTNFS